MLTNFLNKGIQLNIFELKALKNLEGSCANKANLEVIDYDKVKEKIYSLMNGPGNRLKFNQPKSCDALKILPAQFRLDFIEIKGIKDFCDNLQEKAKIEADEKIEAQVQKFNLENKIEQSLDLFKLLLQITQFEVNNTVKEEILNNALKKYIVVIDEEIEEDYAKQIAVSLDFLSTASNYKNEVIIKLQESIDGIETVKISKPVLMSHSKIDQYYEGIGSAVS
ncbi:hypothetical protein [Planococcus shixiaomingii]|uniref:hypothetical protein n=1 Tax=Planococcus shixiaomingii TaxID=3058393 RepID=UPI002633308C|nr:hypothetical protein [Planococcus sp. N022]WKA55516.1 hypothetical protein QWY21_03795 [Planococcus sp. N022]